MSIQFLEDFLGTEIEEGAIPTGDLFTPTGLIAPWKAGIVFRSSWIIADLGTFPELKLANKIVSRSGKYRYYFTNQAEAEKAVKLGGLEYRPQPIWRFETPKAEVLNFRSEEFKARFGDTISYDVPVRALSYRKDRHEFHLIALPYAVQAFGKAIGSLNETLFHANEILMPARENEPEKFTDEFRATMIGAPDCDLEAMFTSTLGQRRAALWKALGEDQPHTYTLKEGRYQAKSESLRQILGIIHRTWTKPSWGEVASFFDPRVEAAYTDTSGARVRPRIAGLVTVFANQAEAQTEAERQLGATAESGPSTPAVPEAWASIANEWEPSIRTALVGQAAFEATSPAAIKIARSLECTVAELMAWKSHLQL